MEPVDNWIEDFKDKTFKIYKFYRMAEQFQKIDISSTNIALAKYILNNYFLGLGGLQQQQDNQEIK